MPKINTNLLIAIVAWSRSVMIKAAAKVGGYFAVRRWRREVLRNLNRRRKC